VIKRRRFRSHSSITSYLVVGLIVAISCYLLFLWDGDEPTTSLSSNEGTGAAEPATEKPAGGEDNSPPEPLLRKADALFVTPRRGEPHLPSRSDTHERQPEPPLLLSSDLAKTPAPLAASKPPAVPSASVEAAPVGATKNSERQLGQGLPTAPSVKAVAGVPAAASSGVAAGATTGAIASVPGGAIAGASAGAAKAAGGLLPSRAAAGTDAPAGATPEAEPIGLFGWAIPPVRWGGSVGYSFQKSTSNTGHAAVSHGSFANLTASSYIYAPWFARVSGRLGITRSATDSRSEGGGSESTRNSHVVGGGEVNMFSSSRFPFRAFFDRSDTRSSGMLVRNDYVSNRFGMTQNFRSADGNHGGNLMFERNAVRSEDGSRDNVTALSGSYSTQTGIVQNNINGRYSLSERSNGGDRARLMGLNSSHIANVSDTVNLGATVNYSSTDIRTGSRFGTPTTSLGRYFQFYGYGSWLPDFEDLEDLPLTLTGGVRYTAQDTQFASDSFRAQSLGLNAGALYRHNRNLTLNGNAAINRLTQSEGSSQLLTQFGAGANYAGNPLTFGNFSYNWNSALNLNWQSAVAETPANTLLSGQFSHSLSRNYTVLSGRNLALAASQSVNISNSQLVGDARSLSHTLSANLGLGASERFTGSVSATLSDVRTTGFAEQQYRMLNVGFFGQGQISPVSNVNVNLMFNWADQGYKTIDGFGVSSNQNTERMTLNGSAAYSHQRFAGVSGLRYIVVLVADTRLRDERLFGNVNGEVDKARFSLTNRLDYRVGLLDLRLSLVNNDVGGKKNALLFFQVSRQIGTY